MSKAFESFDGRCWPKPSERISDIQWRMRYSNSELSREDMLIAASVLSAYAYLINTDDGDRNYVAAKLRGDQ